MINMAGSRKIEVVNGTGAAPLAATADRYSGGIPETGILGTSVPGILDALLAAHGKHGTLPLHSAWIRPSSCAKTASPSATGYPERLYLSTIDSDPIPSPNPYSSPMAALSNRARSCIRGTSEPHFAESLKEAGPSSTKVRSRPK